MVDTTPFVCRFVWWCCASSGPTIHFLCLPVETFLGFHTGDFCHVDLLSSKRMVIHLAEIFTNFLALMGYWVIIYVRPLLVTPVTGTVTAEIFIRCNIHSCMSRRLELEKISNDCRDAAVSELSACRNFHSGWLSGV